MIRKNYNDWSERDFLNDAWGVKPKVFKRVPPLNRLSISQKVEEFDRLANNRLIMGAFRYGLIEEQNFDDYDLISECMKRLELFQKDGNLEHLLDAGNMLKLRFYWGRKKGEYFKANDGGYHAKKI